MDDLKKQASDRAGLKGEYTFFSLRHDVTEHSAAVKLLRQYARGGDAHILRGLMISGVVLDMRVVRNVIPTVGRNVFTRLLAGESTITTVQGFRIAYGAFGSDATAFAESDTILGTEVFRKVPASRGQADDVAFIDWFITAGDVADQTFEEFGAFIGGTSSPDTGTAFSLVSTGGWVKSGSIFVSGKYTLTSAT